MKNNKNTKNIKMEDNERREKKNKEKSGRDKEKALKIEKEIYCSNYDYLL